MGSNGIGHVIGYTFWIVKEVFVAGLSATIAAFKPTAGLAPVIIFYPLRVTTDWDIFWFSTSITATPGTLSVGLRHRTAPGEPEVLIVQAAFGADPQDIIASLADMEEHVNPQVKATPIDPATVPWEPYTPSAERMD